MAGVRRPGASGDRTSSPPTTPEGIDDLLPPDAAQRRGLARRLLRTFELSGYDLVTPPVFEHEEVVDRGTNGNRDHLRFVEPNSGEVAVLRPDITPQIARIVSTRLAERPGPHRLCYEGRVFRRTQGRARSHRQLAQAGVEAIGLAGAAGDVEVIALAARACESVGLAAFRIELSEITLVRSVLEAVPGEVRDRVSEALARKDRGELDAVAKGSSIAPKTRTELQALVDHYGEVDVLDSAARAFRSKAAQRAVGNLREIAARLADLGLAKRVVFDLGETRGLSYYTGSHFRVLASGPGEPLGAGGRYDDLLSRYGASAPATGFALDLDNLQWTLRAGEHAPVEPAPLRIAIGGADASAASIAEALQRRGIVAATLPYQAQRRCLDFAKAWGYDATLVPAARRFVITRVSDGSDKTFARLDVTALRTFVQRAGARRKR